MRVEVLGSLRVEVTGRVYWYMVVKAEHSKCKSDDKTSIGI